MTRSAAAVRAVRGTPAGAGRAAGAVHLVGTRAARGTVAAGEPRRRFAAAVKRTAAELRRLASAAPAGTRAILEGQALIVADPGLALSVEAHLQEGTALLAAVEAAVAEQAAPLDALSDPYLRQRSGDVREAGRRLLAALSRAPASPLSRLGEPSIVVAHDLSAADLLSAPAGFLLGIVTEEGGRTSHVAIVARELGIPAVVGAAGAVAAAAGKRWAELDGAAGTLGFLPERPAVSAAPVAAAVDCAGLPVRLLANVGSETGAEAAARAGALGVGLFRTELLFLGREAPMPEEEQVSVYSAACAALAPHPVVVRTLDAGSDKPLAYLEQAPEPNPALGRRGLRLWLRREELWRPQARALIRAGARHPNLEVMVPMVGAPEEMAEARALFEREAEALRLPVPRLGMMVELPSTIAALEEFSGLASFISLGTNDLTQYALGIDRTLEWEPYLAELSPGVLRLIAQALAAARRLGIESAVCGELAGTPEGAVFLAGAGVDALSMAVESLPRVAEELRRRGRAGCRRAARAALTARTAEAARSALSG